MNRLAPRFDSWVRTGPFTARDLGITRIVYAAATLVIMPRADATSVLPAVGWNPPPGPFRLIDSPPPHVLLLGVEVVLALSLAALLIGWHTTAASVWTAVAYLVADGTTNGYGTIHHFVMLAVVPLTLCWTRWGRALSFDAVRAGADAPEDDVPQWPLRLLALCVGVGFATAAIPKIAAGWLDPSTQAAQGHFFVTFLVEDRRSWLAPFMIDVQTPLLWEALDWATVALELSVILSVLSWTWFRRVLVVLVGFHVAVLLVMNIAFGANVITYVAFVGWSRVLPGRPPGRRHARLPVVVLVGGVAAVGLAVSSVLTPAGRYAFGASYVLVAGAVAFAAAALMLRPSRPSSG